MVNVNEETILKDAISWIKNNKKVALATVIETWGSSPFQAGTKMIINNNGDFIGSVSGGCIEAKVIEECIELLKNKISYKELNFKISDENAWEVGLSCGGNISVYIETID
tara:strand:- start:104 stop:433 length:330 start_codon:yes stop_codon:yes gene_type:complete